MVLYAFLAAELLRPATVVPIKTMMALRRTLDVGEGENLLVDDRDLIFRAGFSTLSVQVQRADIESPGRLESRVTMLRQSQKIMVLDLRQVPLEVDLMPLFVNIRDKWRDQEKLVFHLRTADDEAKVRGWAPTNTLILPINAPDESLPVPSDGNVVFAFGPIGPDIFQNQPIDGVYGAGSDDGRPMFPPEPDRIRQMTRLDSVTQSLLREYGQEKWGVANVRERLQRWVDWGRQHRRYVWWTGLGCSVGAAEASRRRYFETMARSASYFDLGWCLSAYDGPWAVAKGAASSRLMRPETAAVFSSE